MGEKHTGIRVPNSVEMHLLHDCGDLVSMQRIVCIEVSTTLPPQKHHQPLSSQNPP